MVLEDTSERRIIMSKKLYADEPLGLYIVKGDNVVLLGEVGDEEEEGDEAAGAAGGKGGSARLKKVTLEELKEAEKVVDVEAEKKLKTCWDFDLDLV